MQASDLGKSTDALHLLLSWVRALLHQTFTLGVLRAIGLPTDPAFLTMAS
ncbi:MAG: hypothetical protein J2P37_35135 [Ktedonobacteraceae bacterium]|nr:hypothetical protein [Ktedonobacteraceae bacterium]MBO0790826.1 hypothetical protein [Ktedonobacteraceae bacterium]